MPQINGAVEAGVAHRRLAPPHHPAHIRCMWDDPYLESCCRSALHRLTLAGGLGRPPGLKDGPCLERLAGLGLTRRRDDGRFELTADGVARHAREVAGLRPAASG
jgi:hypothetical protein